ncbi:MAG TPA: amidase family protein, partial [Polyangiaceae bacterium]
MQSSYEGRGAPMQNDLSLDLCSLRARYALPNFDARGLVAELWPKLEASLEKHVWIELGSRDALFAAAERLDARRARGESLPLFGIPFAVKDNIDVRGFATTAACPALTQQPERGATVVERLLSAGALCVGKTNLDQLATGLVGVRSPYGVPENPFDATRIPGGSSSGSAIAVASGLVSFALGTDTAGSGRVPAAFNNLVGLKPTRGLLSTRGVIPACRSLDCVSIFALTVPDAAEIAGLCQAYDVDDPYSRADSARAPITVARAPASFRFGVPGAAFLGELDAGGTRAAWLKALARLERIGGVAGACDFSAFADAGALLYEGAWIAERHASVRELVRGKTNELLPVIAELFARAERFSASDAFATTHEL